MLVQTEMERVKFVLRSYLRTRLFKVSANALFCPDQADIPQIEKFAPYILSTASIQTRLSVSELKHAENFGNLLGAQFHASVLSTLPENMRSLTEDMPNMPSMSAFCVPFSHPMLAQGDHPSHPA